MPPDAEVRALDRRADRKIARGHDHLDLASGVSGAGVESGEVGRRGVRRDERGQGGADPEGERARGVPEEHAPPLCASRPRFATRTRAIRRER